MKLKALNVLLCMSVCYTGFTSISASATMSDNNADFPMNPNNWTDETAEHQYYYGKSLPEGVKGQFTGTIHYVSQCGYLADNPDYLVQYSDAYYGYYVKRAEGIMTEAEATALCDKIQEEADEAYAQAEAAGSELKNDCLASDFTLVYKVVPPAQPDVMSYCEESGAVWITPPDGLPDYVQFALKEFPMSFNFMPGEPNNFIYYEHSIEQPEDCKTEFTGVIHVTGVNDIFAGVFYNMPDYLSTASECEWGTYAKRKDNPMTAEEAKALGEQLLQDGKIKSYQLVWRRIAETKDADINSDGSVAADDAQMVLREYVNVLAVKAPSFSKQQKLLADVTNDNLIDAKDALQILKYYVDTLAEK